MSTLVSLSGGPSPPKRFQWPPHSGQTRTKHWIIANVLKKQVKGNFTYATKASADTKIIIIPDEVASASASQLGGAKKAFVKHLMQFLDEYGMAEQGRMRLVEEFDVLLITSEGEVKSAKKKTSKKETSKKTKKTSKKTSKTKAKASKKTGTKKKSTKQRTNGTKTSKKKKKNKKTSKKKKTRSKKKTSRKR